MIKHDIKYKIEQKYKNVFSKYNSNINIFIFFIRY